MNFTIDAEVCAIIARVSEEWALRRGAELETAVRAGAWTWERYRWTHRRRVEIAWLAESDFGYEVLDIERLDFDARDEDEARQVLADHGVTPVCVVETHEAWHCEAWT